MPTRLVHMVIDANDPQKLARFWAGVLGWAVAEEEGEEAADVWPPAMSTRIRWRCPSCSCRCPSPRRPRTACTSIWPPGRQSTRRPWCSGCATWAPGRRHRPGRRAMGRAGGPRGQRVLRAGAAGRLPRHRAGGRGRDGQPGPGGGGRFLGAGLGLGTEPSEDDALVAFRLPWGVGPYFELLRVPDARRSRTGFTSMSRRIRGRIRRPPYGGCRGPRGSGRRRPGRRRFLGGTGRSGRQRVLRSHPALSALVTRPGA